MVKIVLHVLKRDFPEQDLLELCSYGRRTPLPFSADGTMKDLQAEVERVGASKHVTQPAGTQLSSEESPGEVLGEWMETGSGTALVLRPAVEGVLIESLFTKVTTLCRGPTLPTRLTIAACFSR